MDNRNISNVIPVDFSKKRIEPKAHISTARDLDKYSQFVSWLENGIVMVTFDTKAQGVKIPPEFAEDDFLSLNFAHEFCVPDFSFSEKAVWSTLSFDDTDYFCHIPWHAVISLYSPTLGEVRSWV